LIFWIFSSSYVVLSISTSVLATLRHFPVFPQRRLPYPHLELEGIRKALNSQRVLLTTAPIPIRRATPNRNDSGRNDGSHSLTPILPSFQTCIQITRTKSRNHLNPHQSRRIHNLIMNHKGKEDLSLEVTPQISSQRFKLLPRSPSKFQLRFQ